MFFFLNVVVIYMYILLRIYVTELVLVCFTRWNAFRLILSENICYLQYITVVTHAPAYIKKIIKEGVGPVLPKTSKN